jgi:hypothetical protein
VETLVKQPLEHPSGEPAPKDGVSEADSPQAPPDPDRQD